MSSSYLPARNFRTKSSTRLTRPSSTSPSAPWKPLKSANTPTRASIWLKAVSSLPRRSRQLIGASTFAVVTAVLSNRVPRLFVGQSVVATLIIALGAWLMCWTLLHFGSWRFRAKLDEGHRLATGGPFRFVRHPIYMGLNLLALGTAVWIPTGILWASLLLMFVGGDLRARAEEKLLTQVFGDTYSAYCNRTSRFLPGIY